MSEYLVSHPALAAAMVIALGVLAQLIASKIRLPSILLLLVFGVGISPAGLGIFEPSLFIAGMIERPAEPVISTEGHDHGEVSEEPHLQKPPFEAAEDFLFAIVSLAVGIILFEGGLTLRGRELHEIGGSLRALVTVGAGITWLLAGLGCYWIAGLGVGPSVLLGALLIVTGPTVIGPLLRHVRPRSRIGNILKWEGILGDCIGALLAVLVFEVLLSEADSPGDLLQHFVRGIGVTLGVGLVLGWLGARLLVLALKRHLIPDHLQGVTSLAMALTLFVISNLFQHEAGLVTVTIFGIALANQRHAPVHHIIELKEHLTVLLIACLFIVLGARMTREKLEAAFSLQTLLFLAFLIIVVRPVAVFGAFSGSKLTWREKAFISWMAPRGIVAAAVASLFARELRAAGMEEARLLEPVVFAVVVGTVGVYGISAASVAFRLGVAERNPQGLLFVGAHDWARQIALSLQEKGFVVRLLDTNRNNVRRARTEGLIAHHGNILEEDILDDIDLGGVGRMLSLTPNDEANSLAAVQATEYFGKAGVFQLRSDEESLPPAHLRGRLLFAEGVDFSTLSRRFRQGSSIKVTKLTESFGYEELLAEHGEDTLVLFTISPSGKKLAVFTGDPVPADGQTVIAVVARKRSS